MFRSALLVVLAAQSCVARSFFLRSTINNWGSTPMVYRANSGNYCITERFNNDDRFKVSVNENNWNEAYPQNDVVVNQGSGVYDVCISVSNNAVSLNKLDSFTGPFLAECCPDRVVAPLTRTFSKYGQSVYSIVRDLQGAYLQVWSDETGTQKFPSASEYKILEFQGRYTLQYTTTTNSFEAGKHITFRCTEGTTQPGQSVYVIGSNSQLGEWNLERAVKLEPSSYPTWEGVVVIPDGSSFEWKCVKRSETNPQDNVEWQQGNNNVVNTVSLIQEASASFNGNTSPQTGTVKFTCNNGITQQGQSVYVIGSIPALGNWNLADAVLLDSSSYPSWSAEVAIDQSSSFEWKCVKRSETNPQNNVEWQSGPNNLVSSTALFTEVSATF